jgi:predicted RNA-binding Zn-ribbon protein involved in translation (DUF1610 family)
MYKSIRSSQATGVTFETPASIPMSLEIPTQVKKRKSEGDIRGPSKRIGTTCVQHHGHAYDSERAQQEHDYMQDLELEHDDNDMRDSSSEALAVTEALAKMRDARQKQNEGKERYEKPIRMRFWQWCCSCEKAVKVEDDEEGAQCANCGHARCAECLLLTERTSRSVILSQRPIKMSTKG